MAVKMAVSHDVRDTYDTPQQQEQARAGMLLATARIPAATGTSALSRVSDPH
jgi:hypothetical protein